MNRKFLFSRASRILRAKHRTAAWLLLLFMLSGWRMNAAIQNPPLPFIDMGACPFECCHYGTWTARIAQRALKERDRKASLGFRIAPGQKVEAASGVVVTRKPGVVRTLQKVRFEDLSVPAGALLYVLHFAGEGSALFWYEGKTYTGELYAETVHKGTAEFPWDVNSLPVTEWWVQVRQGTVSGWILNPSDFDGMDRCAQ